MYDSELILTNKKLNNVITKNGYIPKGVLDNLTTAQETTLADSQFISAIESQEIEKKFIKPELLLSAVIFFVLANFSLTEHIGYKILYIVLFVASFLYYPIVNKIRKNTRDELLSNEYTAYVYNVDGKVINRHETEDRTETRYYILINDVHVEVDKIKYSRIKKGDSITGVVVYSKRYDKFLLLEPNERLRYSR